MIGTRKIKATWTKEMADELMAFRSIDAEAELTAILSGKIDKEILAEALKRAKRGFETKEEIISFLRSQVKNNEKENESETHD